MTIPTTTPVPESSDEALAAARSYFQNDANSSHELALHIDRYIAILHVKAKLADELAKSLEWMLNVAENADETGYVTDYGFVDLDSLHDGVRTLLTRYATAQKGANE